MRSKATAEVVWTQRNGGDHVPSGSGPVSPGGAGPSYALGDAQRAVDVASGKWVLPIMQLLADRPLRRGELRRLLGDIHQKVLSMTLHRMVATGVVNRTVLREMPPAVLYELTDRGGAYLEALAAMAAWAAADRDRLTAAFAGHSSPPAEPEDPPTPEPGSGGPAGNAAGRRQATRRPLPGPRRGPRPRQALVDQLR
jgi:DNA-binding HxlR family transcriptional regulator